MYDRSLRAKLSGHRQCRDVGPVVLACGVLAVSVVLSACGHRRNTGVPQTATAEQGSQAAVTYNPDVSNVLMGTGLFSGTLMGDERSGCLWLAHPSAPPSELHLVGPYTIQWQPVLAVLVDGRALARAGEKVSVGGSRRPGKFVPGCPIGSHEVVTGGLNR